MTASPPTADGAASADSALFRYFLPGLVIGILLGSMIGLYVGTRSGSVRIPEAATRSTAAPGPGARDDDQPAPQRDEDAPAQPEEPAPTDTPRHPAPDPEAPGGGA